MKAKPLIAGSLLIVALLALIGGVALWKYRELHKPGPPAFIPPMAIDIVTAESAQWQPTATLVGTVVAKRSVTVANETAGVVTEVNFDSGQVVEAGHVLLKQDTATLEADLAAAQAAQRLAVAAIEVAQADIRVAQSDLTMAQSQVKRYQEAGGAISAIEIDRAEAQLRKATADLDRGRSSLTKSQAESEQAAARVDQIRTLLAKKTLTAPFRSFAGMRSVHPGQYLAEGTSIVGLMEVTDDIYLDFAIPQQYTSRVVPGAVVVARSNVLGTDAARITILSMDAQVNPTTRNVRVRASIPNPQQKLRQGMSVDVEVPIDPPTQVVVVPSTAVRRAAFGDHVFVVGPGDPAKDAPGAMFARQRMVTVGSNLGDRVVITSGLEAGEKLAAGGSFKLREGAPVMPAPPPQGSPATGSAAGDTQAAAASTK